MKVRVLSIAFIFMFVMFGIGVQTSYGQVFELHPYAGGFFPGDWEDDLQLKEEGIYGLKGGFFVTDAFQVEGNFGWINHFEFEDTDPEANGILYDVNFTWNFRPTDFPTITPYVTVGGGAVTALIEDFERTDIFTLVAGRREGLTNEQLLNDVLGGRTDAMGIIFLDEAGDDDEFLGIGDGEEGPQVFRTAVMEDNDTFFQFSYGGGVKAERLWGPVGLRADFRGRTMPNYFGDSLTWFEPSGGLLLSWGER